jgi:hypothetical protein
MFRRFCPEKASSVSNELRSPLTFTVELPLTDPQPLVEGGPRTAQFVLHQVVVFQDNAPHSLSSRNVAHLRSPVGG